MTADFNQTQLLEFKCQNIAFLSLNHSYICLQILKELLINERIEPLPELTLDIANGLMPDISIFPKAKIQPNPFRDILRFQERPILAIEVVSSSQTIQEMLQKATQLVNEGVKVVWTVEPYSRTVFVTTQSGETLFHEELIENEGIQVDFSKVFPKKIN
jgi:Uma2 family endonuclease